MFKAGDVVRIKDLKGISSEILETYWISEMVYFIGLEYIIDFIDSDGKVWLIQSNYVWHPEMLELIAKVDENINTIGNTKTGSMEIVVNGLTAKTERISSGDISTNVTKYFKKGENTVEIDVSDIYGSSNGNLEKENKELKDKIEEYIKLNIEKDFFIKDYEETIDELEVKIMSHENIKMNINEDYDNLIKKYNNLVSKYNKLLEHMMEDFI